MPELPEVETMVRGIGPALVGRTLVEATVHDPFLLHGASATEFESRVRGAGVAGVGRRGKWVVIALEGPRGVIVIQPRMTGGFWVVTPARPAHVRLTFRTDAEDGFVWFCDSRRLGRIAWYAGESDAEAAFDRSHGPDALAITEPDLAARLQRTGRGIKPTLMDQKVLAGVGNIYADEILHRARIHPERTASGLHRDEVGRIHRAIGEVLNEAIDAGGSSFDEGYRTVLGREGGFLTRNAVYGRGGQPCPVCAGPILKTKIAGLIGRPTHCCPACQPARRPAASRRPRGGPG